jgi:hypothetical protein
MIKKILVAAISVIALSNAQAAVVFNDGILSANLISSNFSGVLTNLPGAPGNIGTVNRGGGVYALELERPTLLALQNAWGVATTTTGSAGASVSTSILASWGLTASTYYRITGLQFSAGGSFAALNGSVQHSTSFTTSIPGSLLVSSGTSAASNTIGNWSSTTGLQTLSPVSSIANVDLSVALRAQRNAVFSTSSIIGLDDSGVGGFGGESFRGPTLYVSVSAVPEPGEWAMMIAGLGVVGLIARRRRAV